MPPFTLAPGDVRVRYEWVNCVEEDTVRAALAVLTDGERARAARFHFDRDRREFAIAHALLRNTLSVYGDRPPEAWSFEDDADGKPRLTPGSCGIPLSFNLSHSHGLVACAVALEAQVGVDVESLSRTTDWRSIAPRYFSGAEVGQIDRLPEPEQRARFFELWTLKEAFVKALGVGLSQALDATTFDLSEPDRLRCALPPGVDCAVWDFALYRPSADHRLAVAVSDGSGRQWHIDVRPVAESAHASQPLRAFIGRLRQPDPSVR